MDQDLLIKGLVTIIKNHKVPPKTANAILSLLQNFHDDLPKTLNELLKRAKDVKTNSLKQTEDENRLEKLIAGQDRISSKIEELHRDMEEKFLEMKRLTKDLTKNKTEKKNNKEIQQSHLKPFDEDIAMEEEIMDQEPEIDGEETKTQPTTSEKPKKSIIFPINSKKSFDELEEFLQQNNKAQDFEDFLETFQLAKVPRQYVNVLFGAVFSSEFMINCRWSPVKKKVYVNIGSSRTGQIMLRKIKEKYPHLKESLIVVKIVRLFRNKRTNSKK